MEDKVLSVLGIIEDISNSTAAEDACSKRKPELVSFIQEFHKAYRTLAEKYEYITGELQRANNAMASVYPEQAHFGMEDDDDAGSASPTVDDTTSPRHEPSPVLLKEKNAKKQVIFARITSKDMAQEEIDKLQKGILVLQTEKEFVKSSFESGMAKYWDIEKLITQMQEKVNSLMDNFKATVAIEDHEAQALMAITALRSCETNLLSLHEQQKRSTEEAKIECRNIEGVVAKLIALKGQHGQSEPNKDHCSGVEESTVTCAEYKEDEPCLLNQETLELSEKVIRMETRLSIQAAQIRRLRLDIVEIQKHLQILEKEEKIFINDLNAFYHNLELVEEALHRVRDLAKRVQDENTQIRAHFAEACYTFNDLSKRLRFPEPQNECSTLGFMQENAPHQQDRRVQLLPTREKEEGSWLSDDIENLSGHSMEGEKTDTHEVIIDQDKLRSASSTLSNDSSNYNGLLLQRETCSIDKMSPRKSDEKQKQEGEIKKEGVRAAGQQKGQSADVEELSLSNLQQLFQEGLEDREKILLTEYTSILRNYKETKRKLAEAEASHQDHLTRTAAEMRDLRKIIVIKDEEIRTLRQNLHFLESCWNENLEYQAPEPEDLQHRRVACTTEEEGSWFSIAFTENSTHVPGNSDRAVEVDRRALNVVTDAFQQGKQFEAETDVGSSLDSPPSQVDDERTRTKSANQIPPSQCSAVQHIQEHHATTAVEENFRKDIDQLLEENIQFWSKFTSSFEQKSAYQIELEDIQKEIAKLAEEKKQEDSTSEEDPTGKPDAASICKQLNDLQEKISAWIKENSLLKEELHSRLSSLSNMGEEISNASNGCSGGEQEQLTAYHAAKFQGEVLSMQQQNNKVAEELQEGLDCVIGLQSEVTKSLVKLGGSPKQSTSKIQKSHNTRNLTKRLPLRSFLFGSRNKKPALFHCMNPALQKQYSDLAAGIPPK